MQYYCIVTIVTIEQLLSYFIIILSLPSLYAGCIFYGWSILHYLVLHYYLLESNEVISCHSTDTDFELLDVSVLHEHKASMLSTPDGPFINLARLDMSKYAAKPTLAKALFEYIFHHENDIRNVRSHLQFLVFVFFSRQLARCAYPFLCRCTCMCCFLIVLCHIFSFLADHSACNKISY